MALTTAAPLPSANFIARQTMSRLAELIPEAKSLSRVDKLRLIQLFAEELAVDEGNEIKSNQSYSVWSPESAFDAANVMLQTLATEDRS
jgi:hypothetical protein